MKKPIQINPDAPTRKKIELAAKAENRKLGPMVLEIVRRYFAAQSATARIAVSQAEPKEAANVAE